MSLKVKLPAALRELRLLGCQSSTASAGLREFIKTSYIPLKTLNPTLPILIREAQGIPARAFARFEFGVEKQINLDNSVTAEEVGKRIESLLK